MDDYEDYDEDDPFERTQAANNKLTNLDPIKRRREKYFIPNEMP